MEASLTDSVWAIDPIHTRIRFDAKYLQITSVSGWFRELEGTVTSAAEGFGNAEIEALLYTNSIYTGIEERDRHLLSADFFDAGNHPAIRFRSSAVLPEADGLRIEGTLTIKQVSHPISFKAKHAGTVRDPMGNIKAGFEFDAVFNRKDFSISWNQFFDRNGILISDQVHIHGDVQLMRIR
jgi:polyisoprenoid-binding protein YceI